MNDADLLFRVDPQPLRVEVRPCASLRVTAGEEKKGLGEQMEEEEEGLKRVIGFTASKLGACVCTRVIFITFIISITLIKKKTNLITYVHIISVRYYYTTAYVCKRGRSMYP